MDEVKSMTLPKSQIQCVADDKDAFAKVFMSHSHMLYRTAWLYVRNDADAADAVADAALKALKKIHTLKDLSKVSGWLLRITINCARDITRKRKDVPVEKVYPQNSSIDNSAELVTLRGAISSLPDKLKAPLIVHYYHGYTYRETAKILSLPMGTVQSRVHQALKRLRLTFKEDES